MEKIDGKSKDILKGNIEKLKQIFPEIITEGNIDFDKLKSTLGDYADDSEERYNFTWNGKAKAKRLAQTPSTGTLRLCKEESVNWDTTENLFIEGDNLEVLKLLQKTYHKKIKMIYIDPPYNTGKDFIYKDNFKDNIKNYLELTGQVDGEGKKLSANSETSGRYHTDWLNMMYPRLKLARNLLRDNGVIFISIDDSEVDNLKKICNEIFGEENFVANFLWKKKSTTSNVEGTQVSPLCDYTLCYRKTALAGVKQRVKPKEERSYPESDEEGSYRLTVIEKKDSGAYKRDSMKYEIIGHFPRQGKRWQIGKDTAKILEQKNRFIYQDGKVKLKIYDFEDNDTFSAQPNILDSHGTTDSAAKDVNDKLFGISELFDNPKPIELLQHLINLSMNEDDVVLDFFAGSSSTAHAVFNLNKTGGGNYKFIMVQLPEPCNKTSEAFKGGYKTIADIGKERIRRVIKKIESEQKEDKKKSENTLFEEGRQTENKLLDLGFKVFKLDSSNIKAWDSDFDSLEKSLLDSVDNIKKDRSAEDVLHEILLKYGLDLTLPIEERKICKKTVYSIGLGALIVCLDKDISLDVVEGIAKLKEELNPEVARVVFSDAGFKDDVVKTNTIQILKQHGIEDVKSI